MAVNFPQTEFTTLEWQDFSGGKNSRFPSTEIERNQCQDCLNVYSDLRGALCKRHGYTLLSQDGTDPVQTIWAYNKLKADGSFDRYLLKAAGTTVRAYTSVGGGTWSNVATGLTAGKRFGAAEANNKSYFANGADGLKQWDGTTLTAVSGAPAGTWLLVWHRNRMYAATGKSSRLYFSDLGDPTSWPVLNFLDFDVDDGDRITALAEGPDGSLVIFKETSRHVLRGTGPGSYTSHSVRDGIGCVSHWATAQVADEKGSSSELAFLSREGVYLTDGTKKTLISDAITPDVRVWPQEYLHLSSLAYYNQHLHVSLPNGRYDTANTYIWAWDVRGKGWWPWTIPASHLFVWYTGTARMLLAGSPATGRIHTLWDGYNDNGAAINSLWIGKDDDAGKPTHKKRYKRGFATEKAFDGTQALAVMWNQDFGVASTVMQVPVNTGSFPVFDVSAFDVAVFVSAQGVVPALKMVATESAYVRPEVYQNGIDTPFALLGLALEVKVTNRRVGVNA